MINASFFLGFPVSFKNICKVYPPIISDILDNEEYPLYKKILLESQEDLEDYYTELKIPLDSMPTPFQNLFDIINADSKLEQKVKDAFEFFIKEPVLFLKERKQIVIGDLTEVLPQLNSVSELRILEEKDFFEFQNLLRESIGEKKAEPYNPDENPKIRYFKAKARERDRVKAKQGDGLTLGSTLASICCMNFGLNPLNIGKLTQYSISVLIRYFQEKEKYDIDIKSLLAGADSKKVKPQNWIRNIEDL